MTARENTPASGTVWYFIGATFIVVLPMLMFPSSPWWVRVASIAIGGALIAVGIRRLRREASDENDPGHQ